MPAEPSELFATGAKGNLASPDPAGAEAAPSDLRATSATQKASPADYVVVARRYRPKSFDELVGQEHVARALSNAIATNRVGHAYLFTGARGVGKTSAARILAKALDCVQGPTPSPCNACDVCLSVAAGSDVDVLEIDGASNRGIDEIRQLRQNVGVRPSRARFKIYIIDEVHMLTPQAFNALLKTLEEPPEHVKFIFCTTEANKIPITILSRCQRFDFAGIRAGSIRDRLAQIAAAEGVEAEPAALEMLARRAGGSMRDSQSLLEQLLSFGGTMLRAADVQAMLGAAGEERLQALLACLVACDPRGALAELDIAVRDGVEVGQLLEQLLGSLRDVMTAAVGCSPDAFLHTSTEAQSSVVEASKSLGLATILGMMQIVEQALSRLRYSSQQRVLAEAALVRVATLADLESVGQLLEQLQQLDQSNDRPGRSGGVAPTADRERAAPATSPQLERSRTERPQPEPSTGASPFAAAKKKADLTSADDSATPRTENPSGESNGASVASESDGFGTKRLAPEFAETASVDPPPMQGNQPPGAPADDLAEADVSTIWGAALARLPEGMLIEYARQASRIAILAPNRLVIHFPARYNLAKSFCEHPDRLAELRNAVGDVAGREMQIEFEVEAEPAISVGAEATPTEAETRVGSRAWNAQRAAHPLVAATVEMFGAAVVRIDPPRSS